MNEQEIDAALRNPFELADLKWRVQLAGKDKNKPGDPAMMLPYVDARAIMRRFSSVLGVGHWRTETRHDGPESWVCRIWAKIGDEWVWHEDTADETDIEGTKGGASKSLVRCAVRFGVGAYLYRMAFQWTKLEGTGQKVYAPRNWKPDLTKIPPEFRPTPHGAPATDTPPARVSPPTPPDPRTKQQTNPIASMTPVAAEVDKILEKTPEPKAIEAWNKISWAHDIVPVPFMLYETVPSKDASKPPEPYVFFAEAALRPTEARNESGHWSKLRWVIDTWATQGPGRTETKLYKRMHALDEWASLIREAVPDRYLSEFADDPVLGDGPD